MANRKPITEPDRPTDLDAHGVDDVRLQWSLFAGLGTVFAVGGVLIGAGVSTLSGRLLGLALSLFGLLSIWSAVKLYRALQLRQRGSLTTAIVERHGILLRYIYNVGGRDHRKYQWLINYRTKYVLGDHIWILYDPERPERSGPVDWIRFATLSG